MQYGKQRSTKIDAKQASNGPQQRFQRHCEKLVDLREFERAKEDVDVGESEPLLVTTCGILRIDLVRYAGHGGRVDPLNAGRFAARVACGHGFVRVGVAGKALHEFVDLAKRMRSIFVHMNEGDGHTTTHVDEIVHIKT